MSEKRSSTGAPAGAGSGGFIAPPVFLDTDQGRI